MQVFFDLESINGIEPTSCALGNFDGVHIGHRKIIEKAVGLAAEKGLKSAVFTFSNHPKNTIPGRKPVLNIIQDEEKVRLIEELGVDYLFDIEFTEEIMKMAPEEYIEKLLLGKFNAKQVCCGFNYFFGFKASGDTKLLEEEGKRLGFGTDVMPPVLIGGEVVSSTLIRELIKSGDVDECAKFLGRNYEISGEVVVGNRLGRKIGFPTSNLMIDETMVTPPNGVYVTYCIYNGIKYPSITNVGVKPTVGTFKKNMETHIFNFDSELYGKQIRVEFLKKMRDEVKFESVEALSKQITSDCVEAKKYHGV